MAPEETHYLGIAAAVIICVPLLLAGYVYWFLATTYAQQRAVGSSREYVRVLGNQYHAHAP